ncbi:hypothetical protein M3Y99_01595400 [Aphelenchoides fujianensis]|nr:hypothetical protein M3Y99_01595400 [Aphelenchoides fujianensis]
MVNHYASHLAITPFQPDLILNGVRVVKNFQPESLKKLPWPQEKGCRRAQGGDGGKIVAEDIRVVWENDRLIFPVSEMPQAVAERPESNVIKYTGPLHRPTGRRGRNIDYFYILVENVDHKFNAIRFAPDETVVIDPFVKHSMPLPCRFGLDYTAFHRSTNAVESFLPDAINLMKVDRSTPVAVGRIPQRHLASSNEHHSLSKSFAKKILTLEEANAENFQPFGRLVFDPNHVEEVSDSPWPGVATQEGFAGLLEQDFQMAWQPTEAGHSELAFKASGQQGLQSILLGFSGSFAGDEGRPGVEHHPELGVYKANLLITRPDGSFFLRPASTEVTYAMVFALPKHEGKGEPDESTLKAFAFRGCGLRVPAFVWHSVPIPLDPSAIFTEIVPATNANISIEVNAECGHPLQFSQGV